MAGRGDCAESFGGPLRDPRKIGNRLFGQSADIATARGEIEAFYHAYGDPHEAARAAARRSVLS
ncbi:hypothetical protein EAH87_14725 [Sphingomonas koreensis]|nr:hypothetical protein EAH87_14725 [Sphingomonas koreensis]